MSRSIHSTRNEDRREGRFRYADEEAREARLEAIREERDRKRRIKRQVRQERDRPALDLPPVRAEAVPIEVCDEGPHVVYPASPADLRAVMARLPAGTLDGLAGVRLYLGKEYQEERLPPDERELAERDPWLGRVGFENVPGVFGGRILGTYRLEPNQIDLYAYVVDPHLPDPAMWELFFRLRMLSTFVRELAHHQDRTLRSRGRWRTDEEEKDEDYALGAQAAWVKGAVVPYLREAYPGEVEALNRWLLHHGGTGLPLALLADSWSWDADGECHPVYFGSAVSAVEYLAGAVAEGQTLTETRLGFARDLHYGEHYEEALRAIDRVLEAEPGNLEALTLRADIFEHQQEYALAEALARRVLARDAAFADAWMVLADVHEARGQWQALADAAGQGAEAAGLAGWAGRSMLAERVRALVELERFAEAEAELDRLSRAWVTLGRETRPRHVAPLRALLLLRGGRHEEALREAREALEASGPIGRPILRAVRFEAAHLLGRPGEAGELTADDLDRLRRMHHGAWADRLAAEHGLAGAGG